MIGSRKRVGIDGRYCFGFSRGKSSTIRERITGEESFFEEIGKRW
jgi:hypothetical protein